MKIIKNLLLSLLISVNCLFATTVKIPLSALYLSTDNNGVLSAYNAYRDGVGLFISGDLNSDSSVDNSVMNKLVYTYGESADEIGVTIETYVTENGTTEDQYLLSTKSVFEPMSYVEGSSCDDGNDITINDKYVNGICQGEEPDIYSYNGTIKCGKAKVGSSYVLNGVSYLVVDDITIKNNLNRANTLCTTPVTNMASLFNSIGTGKNFTTFNLDISSWDTSNVVTMQKMFYGALAFNQDLNNWDVSKVTDMSYMFAGNSTAVIFNGNIGNWDVSNVENFGYMFAYNNYFNKPLTNWNTSKGTTFTAMFLHAHNFNQAVNHFNVSNATSLGSMFSYAYVFNQSLSNWNTSNSTNFQEMFRDAHSFNQSLDNFNTDNAKYMSGMFYKAYMFNKPLNHLSVSNVIGPLNNMFDGAYNFNQPLNNWDVSNIKYMNRMFYGTTKFNQNISNWNVDNVLSHTDFRTSSGLSASNSPF